MPYAKGTDQSDLVLGGCEQMRRFFWPEYFLRVRIKRHYDRSTIWRPRVLRRSGDDRLMTEVNTVEDADSQKERAGQMR